MPFRYEPPQESRAAGTIADLMLRRGDIAAQQAQQIGAAQARAAEIGGQAWAGAAQNLGQIIGAIPQQIQYQKSQQQVTDLRGLQLQQERDLTRGDHAVDSMMAGDQLPPGAAGPRQPSYLTPDGLFDVSKLSASLAQGGMAHLAPELLKGAERINASILSDQEHEEKATQIKTLLYGDLADGVIQLNKIGMPLAEAMDFVSQPALTTGRIKPQEYEGIKAKIAALPPDQQLAALGTLVNAASKLGGVKTLAKDAIEVDRYGRTVAQGQKTPEKPTKASLAFDLSSPDPDVRARAKQAIDVLTTTPTRTGEDQALDAYAKSIGKTKAEDLTYADRQTFARDKSKITSDQAFQQHMRERQYDNANPTPEKTKTQDALEQEYRTVLARGLSSRSGGLGLEDAKVQQANHLLSLMDQFYDAKRGGYNIPRVQLNELALGLAKLTAPGGQAGIGMFKEFEQRTAKGDLAGALTYLTGSPVPANTQEITTMLRDSIQRQGDTAMQNREGEMAYLRGLAPTTLAEDRRKALEATSLNPLRQSRIIRNTKTGDTKLQVSTDGGTTWK